MGSRNIGKLKTPDENRALDAATVKCIDFIGEKTPAEKHIFSFHNQLILYQPKTIFKIIKFRYTIFLY
jgi:hypothetical protein